MTDRELFEKALEALEEISGGYSQKLIVALRDRLAQPKRDQKPVSEMFLIDEDTLDLALEALHNVTEDYVENRQRTHNRAIEQLYKVFTQKPQRKPLTDKELEQVFPAIATYHEANKTLYRSIARAIEAAHGIKGEA